MDDVDLRYAKEHLEELVARAARGEDVRIVDPNIGAVRLTPDAASEGDARKPSRPVLGQWKGVLTVPERLFDPLSEDDLAWLSGEQSP
jgi:antitoxin (DNA-binding transcriptional repressor) of toxin-antitoxin stability system